MKVALELQPCLKNRSGIGTYTYELTNVLQKSDLKLDGYFFNFLKRHDMSYALNGLNIDIQICSLFPYGVYRRLWNIVPIPYRWLFKQDADIVHFFNFIVPPGVKGKVVTTIHDAVWLRYPETMEKKNWRRISKDIQYSVDRADRIVTVSESTKRDLIELLQVPAEKIVIASPGVDIKKYQKAYSEQERLAVRNRYGLPEQYILCLGNLEPRKNIERLLQAYAQLLKNQVFSKYKLVLVGGKGWKYENIFKQIEQLGLSEHVVFTGYVDEEDKVAIYQMAKLFVYPSLFEGFGMPVAEAMAAGVPVITSNVSSMPEVAGDAGILVNPENVDNIADAMQHLLSDEKLYQQCVHRGLQQCMKFTWERSADIAKATI